MSELRIKKEIYSYEDLNQAIEHYKGYACIAIEEKLEAWTLFFSVCKYDPVLTIKEFENHLIEISNL